VLQIKKSRPSAKCGYTLEAILGPTPRIPGLSGPPVAFYFKGSPEAGSSSKMPLSSSSTSQPPSNLNI
jgi:hypothetical protein